MMLDPLSRVRQFVKQYDTNLDPIVLTVKMKTAEEAAVELGVQIGQITKSMLFRNTNDLNIILLTCVILYPV